MTRYPKGRDAPFPDGAEGSLPGKGEPDSRHRTCPREHRSSSPDDHDRPWVREGRQAPSFVGLFDDPRQPGLGRQEQEGQLLEAHHDLRCRSASHTTEETWVIASLGGPVVGTMVAPSGTK